MRAVVQRVSRARVTVDGGITGEIADGLVILVGVGRDDTSAVAASMAERIANLRIFEGDQRKMNRSLLDVKGSDPHLAPQRGDIVESGWCVRLHCTRDCRSRIRSGKPTVLAFIDGAQEKRDAKSAGRNDVEGSETIPLPKCRTIRHNSRRGTRGRVYVALNIERLEAVCNSRGNRTRRVLSPELRSRESEEPRAEGRSARPNKDR
jgi:hypothetical protein